jgi:hypothetical protein
MPSTLRWILAKGRRGTKKYRVLFLYKTTHGSLVPGVAKWAMSNGMNGTEKHPDESLASHKGILKSVISVSDMGKA